MEVAPLYLDGTKNFQHQLRLNVKFICQEGKGEWILKGENIGESFGSHC
jgi:hypothetical protein